MIQEYATAKLMFWVTNVNIALQNTMAFQIVWNACAMNKDLKTIHVMSNLDNASATTTSLVINVTNAMQDILIFLPVKIVRAMYGVLLTVTVIQLESVHATLTSLVINVTCVLLNTIETMTIVLVVSAMPMVQWIKIVIAVENALASHKSLVTNVMRFLRVIMI
jgi:hypothetical protein